MPLASEVTTWPETNAAATVDGLPVVRWRTRVRTNASPDRFRRRLQHLGLLERVESITRSETNWHWTGTGQGYEILWRPETTFADLLSLARF